MRSDRWRRLFLPRGPVKDGYIVYVITRYSSLLSVTGVGHVDVV